MNKNTLAKYYSRIVYSVIFLLLMVIDIGPAPVTAIIGLYVVLFRPRWFKAMIDSIY